MTSPRFNGQISLGNVISIVVVLFGLAGGWFTLQAQVVSISEDIGDHEARLRVVEQTTITQRADLRATDETLRDIKAQLSENNRLLRELLSRGDRQ